MATIDIPYIRQCFSYCPATGSLYWTERPREHFASEAAYKTYLHRVGQSAGGIDTSTGYRVVGLGGKIHYAHRIAWALHHGAWPDVIDHINGDKLDNKIENLRSVTQMENAKNARLGRNNSSGANGVGFDKRSNKWRARIMAGYREVYSALFDQKEDAIKARESAQVAYGFHANHGRVAARNGINLGDEQ